MRRIALLGLALPVLLLSISAPTAVATPTPVMPTPVEPGGRPAGWPANPTPDRSKIPKSTGWKSAPAGAKQLPKELSKAVRGLLADRQAGRLSASDAADRASSMLGTSGELSKGKSLNARADVDQIALTALIGADAAASRQGSASRAPRVTGLACLAPGPFTTNHLCTYSSAHSDISYT